MDALASHGLEQGRFRPGILKGLDGIVHFGSALNHVQPLFLGKLNSAIGRVE
jgi:hypothetical protein